MQKEILVKLTDFSEEGVSTRDEGRLVLIHLLKLWKRYEKIILDFSNIQIASVSFCDEVFGTLSMHFNNDELKAKLTLVNIDPLDKQTINTVIAARRKELETVK
jgi:hypothetical protein